MLQYLGTQEQSRKSKSLKRNLEELGADVAPELLQKSMVLQTAHVIRRVMDSQGDKTRPRVLTL